VNNTVKDYEKLSEQYNKMIAERNSLIDDLSWYKAKVSRLERENEQLKESRDWDYEYIVKVNEENKRLKRENERLRVKSDSFFESWRFKSVMYTDLSKESDKYKSLLSEFSQHIGNKPSSSTYKYFRAKLDDLNITEGK